MNDAPSLLVLSSDLLILITIHLNIRSYRDLETASMANSAYDEEKHAISRLVMLF